MSAPHVTTAPRVVAVTESSPADRSGLLPGDELLSLNGRSPRDVIEYSLLVDEPELDLVVRRRGLDRALRRAGGKEPGEPLGVEVSSAVFDRVRTCDNHCEFCFIHQLPKGMRRSLSLKDDDYRLSFLYGNFTTLTRFTETDLERVLTERPQPAVRVHPRHRPRGARRPAPQPAGRHQPALAVRPARRRHRGPRPGRGLPGQNDGAVLDDTLAGVLDRYPGLATVACVPLGVSRFSHESAMRPHTRPRPPRCATSVDRWQETFLSRHRPPDGLRRRRVLPDGRAALSGRPHLRGLPPARERPRHGPGLRGRLRGRRARRPRVRPGFFAAVDGAPASGYRAPRGPPEPAPAADRDGGQPPHRHAHRRVRRPGARSAGRLPRPRRHPAGAGGQHTSSAATSGWPACSPAPT